MKKTTSLLMTFTGGMMAAGIFAALLPSTALAQDDTRVGPLVNAPAIRNRVELRDKRFELGAGLGGTIGQDFYHAVLVNAKLGFHLNDWIALTAMVGQNLTPDFRTAMTDRLVKSLDQRRAGDRGPTPEAAIAGMNKISQVGSIQAEVAAITGKFSLFGKLFFNYDFYGFGGGGFVNYSGGDSVDCGKELGSCPVTGVKGAFNFGGGFHAFVNDLIAINVELRDILLRNNPAGRDVNADRFTTKDDLTWDNNFILAVNAQFFLPSQAKRSD